MDTLACHYTCNGSFAVQSPSQGLFLIYFSRGTVDPTNEVRYRGKATDRVGNGKKCGCDQPCVDSLGEKIAKLIPPQLSGSLM